MPKIDKSAPVLSPQPVVKSSEELQKSIEHIEEELKVELAYLVNNGQQKNIHSILMANLSHWLMVIL